MCRVSRLHNPGIGNAERDRRRCVDDVLVRWRRVVAGVKITDAAWPMAMGAVDIQIGAHAIFERGVRIRDCSEFWKTGDARLVNGGAEKSEPVQSADLIVGFAGGGISETAIKLAGVDTENIPCRRRVARQTIRGTGVIPRLRPDAGRLS